MKGEARPSHEECEIERQFWSERLLKQRRLDEVGIKRDYSKPELPTTEGCKNALSFKKRYPMLKAK